jgi:hypothetical protein
MIKMKSSIPLGITYIALSLLIGGCGGGGGSSSDPARVETSSAAGGESAYAASTKGALAISGTPSTFITQGMTYSFMPAETGGNATRTFSITNKPAWAAFDSSTGLLSGTPDIGDIGMVISGITISVTTGQETAALPPFSITILATGPGVAELSWTPSTQNADNGLLSGYKVYYSTTPGYYPNSQQIDNPGITTSLVENLAPGTWSFIVTAFDQFGRESNYSNTATKTISAP